MRNSTPFRPPLPSRAASRPGACLAIHPARRPAVRPSRAIVFVLAAVLALAVPGVGEARAGESGKRVVGDRVGGERAAFLAPDTLRDMSGDISGDISGDVIVAESGALDSRGVNQARSARERGDASSLFPWRWSRSAAPWFMTWYQGVLTPKYFSETLTEAPEFEEQFFTGIGIGRKVAELGEDLALDVEAAFARHYGKQEFDEAVACLLFRYFPPFFDPRTRFSLAIGEGVSYASELPDHDVKKDQKTTRWINYMAWEISFAAFNACDVDCVLRLHHRSSVFGLIDNGEADSNYVTFGLRWFF